jgi:hypothetical protein
MDEVPDFHPVTVACSLTHVNEKYYSISGQGFLRISDPIDITGLFLVKNPAHK